MSERLLSPSLSADEVRQIEQICDRFEADCKAGQRPLPEEYLDTAAEPARSALLRQLLLLDWDYRRRAGDDPSAGDYLPRFPGDPALIEDVRREMTEPLASTRPGSDEPQATPWPGAPVPGPRGEAAQRTEAGAARYDLLQEVGRGGIGVVFRASDRLLGRELAVKVLREDHRDKPDAQRRFVDEARVGSQLQHPAIVPVYEQGWFGDRRPYFTMKLVQGHTLAALLQRRADPGQDLPRLLGIFEQVCQAIAYAHARGVVHRDLKPSNVMVGAFGEVQVMDWGFAKVLADDGVDVEIPSPEEGTTGPVQARPVRGREGATQSGALMGTPAYMPPEQARGEAALIDQRADVFALGAILCEILTGQPPYASGTDAEVCRQAAAGDLHDAHARLDACAADEALRELARRCLAAERTARPADAGGVARDVTAYLASAQERLRQAQLDRAASEARAEEARAKAKAERRARRLTLGLGTVVLVAGIVGTTLGLAEAWHQGELTEQALKDEAEQRRAAVRNEQKAKEEEGKARAAGNEARRLAAKEKAARDRAEKQWLRAETLLYISHVTEAHNHLLNHDLIRCRLALDQCREDLRGPEYGYLVGQFAKKARTLPGHAAVSSLALSSDGRRLYSGSHDRTIRVWDLATGKETLTLRGHDGGIVALALSGDGKRLASGGYDSAIKVWDLATGKETLILRGHQGWVTGLALSGDGSRLVSGGADRLVKVRDLGAGR